jgi:hypothetical protein
MKGVTVAVRSLKVAARGLAVPARWTYFFRIAASNFVHCLPTAEHFSWV